MDLDIVVIQLEKNMDLDIVVIQLGTKYGFKYCCNAIGDKIWI